MSTTSVPEGTGWVQTLLAEHGDVLRTGLARLLRELMEVDVGAQIGAAHGERTPDRQTWRNGYRDRPFDTRLGALLLRIPKLRDGTYFPSFLEPRRRAERALMAVVQEAYVHGVSTRSVDDLVQALGGVHVDKSTVSRWCADLDVEAEAFRTRPLEVAIPYLWLDAVYEKVRENGRVVSKAVVVAIGVTAEGVRTVAGVAVGQTESAAFWTEFLRSLVRRGLRGVQLVISDAHEGIQAAARQVLQGAAWQRCRVHTMRTLLAQVPRGQQGLVAAMLRTIFAQPMQAEAQTQCTAVQASLAERWPAAAARLAAVRDDVLAYMAFPTEHWTQLHSTNPLERVHKEIRRRTRVIGIFPNDAALTRLVAMLLAEQDDEWQAATKAYMSRGSLAKLTAAIAPVPQLAAALTG